MKSTIIKDRFHYMWRARRLDILERDGNKCVKCNYTKYLNIHHKVYCRSYKYWEYSSMHLETLCRKCHIKVHKNKSIESFIKPKSKVNKSAKWGISSKIYKLFLKAMYKKSFYLLHLYARTYKTFSRIDCEELSFYVEVPPSKIKSFLIEKGTKYIPTINAGYGLKLILKNKDLFPNNKSSKKSLL